MHTLTKRISAAIAVLAAVGFSAASANAVVQPPTVPPGPIKSPDPDNAVVQPPTVPPGPIKNTDPDIGNITTASLSVYKNFTIWNTDVNGIVSMPPTDAQRVQDLGYKIKCSIYGRDYNIFGNPIGDTLLLGPSLWNGGYTYSPDGLPFRCSMGGTPAQLDEDQPSFPLENGQDELVAKVVLIDPNGNVVRSAETNVVHGYF